MLFRLGMSDTELIWAAGFYDGEGCTSLSGSRPYRYVRCALFQNDPEPLLRFQKALGGIGTVSPVKRGGWWWSTTSDPSARVVITSLYPYLCSIKRAQANKTIAASTWKGASQFKCTDPTHTTSLREGRRRCVECTRKKQRVRYLRWKERQHAKT